MTDQERITEEMANHDKHYWALVQRLKRRRKGWPELADLIGEGSTVAKAIWDKYENFDFNATPPTELLKCPTCGDEISEHEGATLEEIKNWKLHVCPAIGGAVGLRQEMEPMSNKLQTLVKKFQDGKVAPHPYISDGASRDPDCSVRGCRWSCNAHLDPELLAIVEEAAASE